MKTLVYFASGHYRRDYSDLPFDRVYLVDNILKRYDLTQIDNVTLLGRDCLESVEYFKSNEILVDYFVSLNEGLGEGGGSYAINSDMVLGYTMPIFKDTYYHMMYKGYYGKHWNIKMDLPYYKEELARDDPNFFDPMIFSEYSYNINAKVYKMTKKRESQIIFSSEKLKVRIIHDSIWCDYDTLDALFLTIRPWDRTDFFHLISKVNFVYNFNSFRDILYYCNENQLVTVGFTPSPNRMYYNFFDIIKEWDQPYPTKINMYHLNSYDYEFLKMYKDKV